MFEFEINRQGNEHLFTDDEDALLVTVECDGYEESASRSGHPDTWHPGASEFEITNVQISLLIDDEWVEVEDYPLEEKVVDHIEEEAAEWFFEECRSEPDRDPGDYYDEPVDICPQYYDPY